MKPKYRIVKIQEWGKEYFQIETKRWWFPFWSCLNGGFFERNFYDIRDAKVYLEKLKLGRCKTVVYGED
jgi:hypothetical protein